MLPASATATTAMAFCKPSEHRRVPSTGSTATSVLGGSPLPIFSPMYSMGASSFSPSPMITVPSMSIELSAKRIASTAA
jgi:hypothetical protein